MLHDIIIIIIFIGIFALAIGYIFGSNNDW